MVGRIPIWDMDPYTGGMDMDSRTNMDTDARGINAYGWGIDGRRSHIDGMVDVGTPRVPAPLGGLGSLRSNQG